MVVNICMYVCVYIVRKVDHPQLVSNFSGGGTIPVPAQAYLDTMAKLQKSGLHLGFFSRGEGQNSCSGIPGEANTICQSHTINLKGGQTSSKGGGGECSSPPPLKCSPGSSVCISIQSHVCIVLCAVCVLGSGLK